MNFMLLDSLISYMSVVISGLFTLSIVFGIFYSTTIPNQIFSIKKHLSDLSQMCVHRWNREFDKNNTLNTAFLLKEKLYAYKQDYDALNSDTILCSAVELSKIIIMLTIFAIWLLAALQTIKVWVSCSLACFFTLIVLVTTFSMTIALVWFYRIVMQLKKPTVAYNIAQPAELMSFAGSYKEFFYLYTEGIALHLAYQSQSITVTIILPINTVEFEITLSVEVVRTGDTYSKIIRVRPSNKLDWLHDLSIKAVVNQSISTSEKIRVSCICTAGKELNSNISCYGTIDELTNQNLIECVRSMTLTQDYLQNYCNGKTFELVLATNGENQ